MDAMKTSNGLETTECNGWCSIPKPSPALEAQVVLGQLLVAVAGHKGPLPETPNLKPQPTNPNDKTSNLKHPTRPNKIFQTSSQSLVSGCVGMGAHRCGVETPGRSQH